MLTNLKKSPLEHHIIATYLIINCGLWYYDNQFNNETLNVKINSNTPHIRLRKENSNNNNMHYLQQLKNFTIIDYHSTVLSAFFFFFTKHSDNISIMISSNFTYFRFHSIRFYFMHIYYNNVSIIWRIVVVGNRNIYLHVDLFIKRY